MAKRGPRRLKFGVQSRFGPNSTVEFEAVFRKKFGVAYCTPTFHIESHNPSWIYYWHEIQVPLYTLEIPEINKVITEVYLVS